MRWLMLIATLNALLQPVSVLAQCEVDDWYTATTLLPIGGAGVQNLATERFVVSQIDHSVYRVDIYQAGADGSVHLLIDDQSNQPSALPYEKVLVVQKVSSTGALQWLRAGSITNSASIYGLTTDYVGNIYFGGTFSGVFTYDGDTLFENQNGGHFTLKVLPSGDLGWHRAGNRGTAVRHTWSDNGLLMLISLTDSVTFNGQVYHKQTPVMSSTNEYLVLMVNPFGEVTWHDFVSGLGLKTIDVACCRNGNCLIQGRFSGELSYESEVYSNGHGRLFQIAMNSENGDKLWMRKQENSGIDTDINVYDSEFLDDGSVITVGHYIGTPSEFSFQGQTIASPNGLTDGFVMRQDASNGSLVWLNSLGAPGYSTVFGAARTATGVAIGGFFDSAELNYEGVTLTNHSNKKDPFILILDSDGRPTCHVENLGTEDHDQVSCLSTLDNDLYVFMPVIDSISFGQFTFSSLGSDQVIWKTCLPCDTLTSITDATDTQPALQLYPIPASTTVQLAAAGHQLRSITVTDMLGHVVLHQQTQSHEQDIDISGLANGLYTVAATLENGESRRQRLVKQ